MQTNNNDFLTMLWIAVCGFFSAFCKEINDRAYNKETTAVFIGEIMLHGVSGTLIGIFASNFTDKLSLITCAAGVGGIFGYNLLKVIFRYAATYYGALKDIKIELNDLEDDKHEKK